MRTYRVTFQPHTGRSAEDVQADRMSIERVEAWLVQHADVLVIGQPREIVVRCLPGRHVLAVELLAPYVVPEPACQGFSADSLIGPRLLTTLKAPPTFGKRK